MVNHKLWLFVAVISMGAAQVHADSLGTAFFDSTSPANYSQNADGSIHLQTFSSSDKAAVAFGNGGVLGTLGNITGFSADFLKSSSTANPADDFAIRLFTNSGGTEGLVWENNYNGNSTIPVGTWQSFDFKNGLFWERANSQNFDTNSNFQTLGAYAGGFTPIGGAMLNANTSIYGIEVSYGSGIGAFDGTVANVQLDFTNNSFDAATVAPLPATAIAGFILLGTLGIFVILRKRFQQA
jgi:hypothetical protein